MSLARHACAKVMSPCGQLVDDNASFTEVNAWPGSVHSRFQREAEGHEVRGAMSGCKVQRSSAATDQRQVFGRSGHSAAEPAAAAVDRLPDIGWKITLNGGFLIARPAGLDP